MRLRITAITTLLVAVLLLCGCNGQSGNHTVSADSAVNISENDPNNSVESTYNSNSELENGEQGSSSDSIHDTGTPLSFTDEDLELQKILSDLSGAETIYYWFTGFSFGANAVEQKIRIINSQNPDTEYIFFLAPKNYQDDNINFPSNYSEMENMVGRFFTKQATGRYMERFYKGSVIDESNGILDILLDSESTDVFPIFLEADSRLYRLDAQGTNILNMDGSTARVTTRGDGIIEFTYLPYYYEYQQNIEFAYEETYSSYAQTGYIVLEDGIWKLPYWGVGGFEQR